MPFFKKSGHAAIPQYVHRIAYFTYVEEESNNRLELAFSKETTDNDG